VGLLPIHPDLGVATPSSSGTDAQVSADTAATDAVAPDGLGDLANGSAFGLGALDLDVQKFLGQLDDLRLELRGMLYGMGIYPWLLALAVAVAASEMRRRQQRAARELALALPGEDGAVPWSMPLGGVLPREPV